VGSEPYALVWNSTNNNVYCANGDNVSVIDGATNRVIATIPVGSAPRAFAWNSIQNRVYVANYSSSSISVLRDNAVGIVEMANGAVRMANGGATIVRNVLNLEPARDNLKSEICLLDISGRKVLELKPGANDVRQLAPGVYFVRSAPQDGRLVQKVVITR